MVAGVEVVLDGSHEHTPALRLVVTEVRKPGDHQLLKHLPDIEKVFRPRAELGIDVQLADVGPWHKPERRPEVLADLLPVDAEVPQIIRVADAEAE